MQTASFQISVNITEEKDIVKDWDRDTDVFIYAGDIFHGLNESLSDAILSKKQGAKILFFLNTPGGVASEAYKLARFLQKSYNHFTIGVTAACKSAGTLLALGAHTVAMGPRGELGPLDVQVVRPDEVLHRSSGLTLSQSLESIGEQAFKTWEHIFLEIKRRSGGTMTTRTASDVACQLTSSICSSICQGVDPYHLGDMKRAVDIAYHYGIRLGASPAAVRHLIDDYPEHGFVIDMEEAKSIFSQVRELTAFETRLVRVMGQGSTEAFAVDVTKDYPRDEDYLIHLDLTIEEDTHENTSSDHGEAITSNRKEPNKNAGEAAKTRIGKTRGNKNPPADAPDPESTLN